MVDLQVIWFVLLGVLLTGYAILDGFDLGVGMLFVFARGDKEKRIFMNAIGPLWDGNEVWLVTFGGALFAAFPIAYAAIFSTFYTPFMMLLAALIFRAVSIEFRSKRPGRLWRGVWGGLFFLGSTLAPLLFGVAVGNAMQGIAINKGGVHQGTFFDFLTPYTVLVGGLVVTLFAMHGALFLYLKTEETLQKRIGEWMWTAFGLFGVFYIMTTILTLQKIPSATANFEKYPWAWGIVLLNVLAIANIPRSIYRQRPGQAFLSSCVTIVGLNALFGIALFPNMVVSSIDPAFNVTIQNAASSEKTLTIMLTIAVLGIPFVLAYTAAIYWVFRGKVKLGEFSY